MKKTGSITLVLGLAAAIFYPAVASAQIAHGSFSLPFEAHWGGAVLPPGRYTLTVNSLGVDAVAYVHGNNQSMALHAWGFSDFGLSGKSALTLVRRGGSYWVRTLYLEHFGAFNYSPPKGERLIARNGKGKERLVAQGSNLIQRLPLSMDGM